MITHEFSSFLSLIPWGNVGHRARAVAPVHVEVVGPLRAAAHRLGTIEMGDAVRRQVDPDPGGGVEER